MRRVDRFLKLFADVRSGESATALLLALNVFLILMAYYVLKPVREALILGEATAELKTYLSAIEVVLLGLMVPYYGRLVRRLDRRRLINTVTGFFVLCLGAFYVLGKMHISLGIAFFLWISIFNMMIVAQFWSFANDVFSQDEGERLFPIVGFGASFGAVLGAGVARYVVSRVGVLELMLVGAVLLVIEVAITNVVDHRELRRRPTRIEPSTLVARPSPDRSSAFTMVFRNRYLLMIALVLMLHNGVKTTGEYLLGHAVRESAIAEVGIDDSIGVQRAVAGFYSSFYAYVNIVGLVLQLFVVSRVVRRFGVSLAVMALPLVAMMAYGIIGFMPLLPAIFWAKVTENATDYSLNNTVRNMLFLPCTTEQKYSAKQAIDSFFVRLGDVVAAVVVFVGTTWLGLQPRGFALVSVGIVAVWLALAWAIGRQYQTMSAPADHAQMVA